ncbi:MAG: UvrD-helicase domain-containing protein [Mangrovibacterium sp.]|nr:UvrD-helicase domain-containing protein [Mangrovibacterium sp.]
MSKLQIYKASAGAGKTFRLTVEYLKIAIDNHLNYKNILAVTFTNKATTEMKYRVVQELYRLGRGEQTACLDVLKEEMQLPAEELAGRAKKCLKSILHDYSRLSISTIDSFFQRVLKAFSREMGINTAWQVDLDDEHILDEAVDALLLSIDQDPELLEWLKQFALEKIREGSGWNLKGAILRLGRQIYHETFKALKQVLYDKLNDKLFIRSYRVELQQIVVQFENRLKQIGREGLRILEEASLTVSDFKYGAGGAVNSFTKMVKGELAIGARLLAGSEDASTLYKTPAKKETAAAALKIQPLLAEAVNFYQGKIREYHTAKLIVDQLYTLGILVDLQEMVRKVTREKGVVLISESGSLLKQIIADSETPFVYEKTGVWYRHFMIDEFQDTSGLQWSNFKPLIENSLAENNLGMVVGDVKQAIYRWRNGDWNLLASEVAQAFPANGASEQQLRKNWRSAGQIVRFNNRIFRLLPAILQQHFRNELDEAGCDNSLFANDIEHIYQESIQETGQQERNEDGYIRMRFLKDKKKSDDPDEDAGTETQRVILDDLIQQIGRVQETGAAAREIAVLVRRKEEAALVAKRLLAEKAQNSRWNFNVLSSESLYVKNASSVSFILSLLALLLDPADQLALARANFLYYSEIQPALSAVGKKPRFRPPGDEGQLSTTFREPYRPGLSGQFESFRDDDNVLYAFVKSDDFTAIPGSRNLQESIFGLCEIFRLFELQTELAYLQAFIDQVNAFVRSKNSDLSAFLSWWEEQGQKKTIAVSEDLDAIRIQTIHKAKGLEYHYVFIPFCDWSLTISARHAPVLWCKPSTSPFNRLELVPVRYASAMRASLFSREYFTEKLNHYIDNLNLLYVAFTRARSALFTWSVYNNKLTSMGDLLLEGIRQDPEVCNEGSDTLRLASFFQEEPQLLESGTLKSVGETLKQAEDGIHLQNFCFSDFSKYLRLRKNYENFFEAGAHPGGNVNKGRLIHEILAKIKHAGELHRAVRELVFQGMLTWTDADSIRKQLGELIADPDVASWFDGSFRVMNERNILTGKNGLKRPDRIMVSGDRVIVVDYKSGELERDQYRYQLRSYMRALEACGYERITGFIWYTRTNKRVEVTL